MKSLLKISLPGAVLTHFSGAEAISEPFSYQLTFWMKDGLTAPVTFLNQTVLVQIQLKHLSHVHGYLVSVRQEFVDSQGVYFKAEMVPWFYYLKIQVSSRIFKNTHWIQIFKEVCQGAGFYDVDFSLVKRSYPVREYAVQYQESSFDFLSRLLQEEHVFYYFRHETNKHVLCLFDSTTHLNKHEVDDLDLSQCCSLQDSFYQNNSAHYLQVGLKIQQHAWITEVMHEAYDFSSLPFVQALGVAQAYHNQFQALDLNVFPALLLALPVITGVDSAHVLAPANGHADIKVLFPWNRSDDSCTSFIRVAQAYVGDGSGQQFIPHVGDDIFVEYRYGNPEQPQVLRSLVVGHVQHGIVSGAHSVVLNEEGVFHIDTEGDYRISVLNDESVVVGESFDESLLGSAHIDALGFVSMAASANLTIQAGAGYLMISPSLIEIQGGVVCSG